MMTREEFLKPWKPGYIVLTMREWHKVAREYPGEMLSPGGVAAVYSVTRQAVLDAAKRGAIYYFVSEVKPGRMPFVLVADMGLNSAFPYAMKRFERRVKKMRESVKV